MRRWIAVLLLVMVATFLAASGSDHCHDGPENHGQQAHILCLDDCAPAMVAACPAPPPPDALPRPVYEETVTRPILNLDLEPEKAPPRA